MVLKFLNELIFDSQINFSYLVRIPKISNPVRPSDFMHICLCNVIYKLMLKVIANRLKKILSDIIPSNESAFIPRRMIIDNVIVAYKSLHSMKTRQKG